MEKELPATWKTAIKLWWSLTWRGFLVALVLVPLFTYIVGNILKVLEIGGKPAFAIIQFVPTILGIIILICVIRWILARGTRGFRIILVEKEKSE